MRLSIIFDDCLVIFILYDNFNLSLIIQPEFDKKFRESFARTAIVKALLQPTTPETKSDSAVKSFTSPLPTKRAWQ